MWLSLRVAVSLLLAALLASAALRQHGPVPLAVAQDGALCAARSLQVYHRPAGPWGAAGCVCAGLLAYDLNQSPVRARLDLVFDDGVHQIKDNVAQGSGVGIWNTTWSGAGCP